MARKKIREYDSKRILKEHIKRLAGIDLPMNSAQVSRWDTASQYVYTQHVDMCTEYYGIVDSNLFQYIENMTMKACLCIQATQAMTRKTFFVDD